MNLFDIEFSFQTNFLPPPLAFAYVLKISSKSLDEGKPEVDLEIEYLDREDFSDEMLLEEGAPINDYLEWSGKLNGAWQNPIKELLRQITVGNEQDQNEDYLYMVSADKTGHVKDVAEVQALLQEVIQAIYETAKIERPLNLEILQGADTFLSLEGQFSVRSLVINGTKMPWADLRLVLGYLENLELSETPSPLNKVRKGLWITYDQANYYKIHGLMAEKDSKKIIELLQENILGQ